MPLNKSEETETEGSLRDALTLQLKRTKEPGVCLLAGLWWKAGSWEEGLPSGAARCPSPKITMPAPPPTGHQPPDSKGEPSTALRTPPHWAHSLIWSQHWVSGSALVFGQHPWQVPACAEQHDLRQVARARSSIRSPPETVTSPSCVVSQSRAHS